MIIDAIPNALENDCSACSAKQKELAEKAIPYISKNYPTQWQELLDLFDKSHAYRNKHAQLAAEKGVAI